jgi:hypothetical protein
MAKAIRLYSYRPRPCAKAGPFVVKNIQKSIDTPSSFQLKDAPSPAFADNEQGE